MELNVGDIVYLTTWAKFVKKHPMCDGIVDLGHISYHEDMSLYFDEPQRIWEVTIEGKYTFFKIEACNLWWFSVECLDKYATEGWQAIQLMKKEIGI